MGLLMKRTLFVFLMGFIIGTSSEVSVDMSQDWIPSTGWAVTCSWTFTPGDRLFSATLYKDFNDFFTFRPQELGRFYKYQVTLPGGASLDIECSSIASNCIMLITSFSADLEGSTFACKVSGEGPRFRERVDELRIKVFVPPSEPSISLVGRTSTQVILNCTASGLPTPDLIWTISGQLVPPNFTGKYWDNTARTSHSWASLSVDSVGQVVTCHSRAKGRNNVDIVRYSTYTVKSLDTPFKDVNISQEWIPGRGWAVQCSWELPAEEKLQSVRLYRNDRQFLIYKPEKLGALYADVIKISPDTTFDLTCSSIASHCIVVVVPNSDRIEDFDFTCEISEGPEFRMGEVKEMVKIYVPPTGPSVLIVDDTPTHITLNCSSSGLPTPDLKWTVDGQLVQSDFGSRYWINSTKTSHVWAVLSLERKPKQKVTCYPTVLNRESYFVHNQTYTSGARRLSSHISPVVATLLMFKYIS